jgi:hypothetical protein
MSVKKFIAAFAIVSTVVLGAVTLLQNAANIDIE